MEEKNKDGTCIVLVLDTASWVKKRVVCQVQHPQDQADLEDEVFEVGKTSSIFLQRCDRFT